MNIHWNWFIRRIHYWGTLIIFIPLIIVLISGILLQFKKQSAWIQPKTINGQGNIPLLSFEKILEIAKNIPVAEINNWQDINRLDVRPEDGIIKVQAKNHWEIQIDHQTGHVLQIAYRRSDVIESIHDGTFFHDNVKLWLFFPVAIVLFILWISGIYLFVWPFIKKNNRKIRN